MGKPPAPRTRTVHGIEPGGLRRSPRARECTRPAGRRRRSSSPHSGHSRSRRRARSPSASRSTGRGAGAGHAAVGIFPLELGRSGELDGEIGAGIDRRGRLRAAPGTRAGDFRIGQGAPVDPQIVDLAVEAGIASSDEERGVVHPDRRCIVDGVVERPVDVDLPAFLVGIEDRGHVVPLPGREDGMIERRDPHAVSVRVEIEVGAETQQVVGTIEARGRVVRRLLRQGGPIVPRRIEPSEAHARLDPHGDGDGVRRVERRTVGDLDVAVRPVQLQGVAVGETRERGVGGIAGASAEDAVIVVARAVLGVPVEGPMSCQGRIALRREDVDGHLRSARDSAPLVAES